ncbi:glycine oxidase ThiO [Yinghuangia seranimata]|uniref:glycine oxidase ThiO n=1 Tax=Yinghuangia seranimata TaxID=408067 RepID=UPI00248B5612|nr:glycine oxidase ThiO [Yinghuangia seranimata]MDI2126146.1 glycine oxidase ThiO [Yinghuangia seranimata]
MAATSPARPPGAADPARAADAVVIGGGVIGLSIAWRAARRGLTVTVVDPAPGTGASHAAAGMLTPVSELQYGEEALLRLNMDSADRYPAFAAELEEASGLPSGYRACGTLAVALDADDRAVLKDLHAFQARLGLASEWLTSRECRRLEPMLSPQVAGGLHVDGDHQIDNRRLVAALLAALDRTPGVTLVRERAAELLVAGDRATGVRLADGRTLSAGQVVLAAGCRSDELPGLPPGVLPPIRPVKGEILRLRIPGAYAPFLSRNVRGVVKGGSMYLVPRADGELVVGATEHDLSDTEVTAGGVYELLRDAHELVPGITELPLVETYAGLRPGSPDNAPVVGASALDGLVVATGHYRHGVLLTPVTADAVAELLAEGTVPDVVRPWGPLRFTAPNTAHRPDGGTASSTASKEVSYA